MRPLGLRTKLTLSYTGLFALVLCGFSALFYRTLTERVDRSVNDALDQQAAGLRGYLDFKEDKPTLVYDPDDPEETYFIRTATRYYQVYDAASGQLLTQSPELGLLGLTMSPEEVRGFGHRPRFTEVQTPKGGLRFHNYIVTSGHRPYLIQVGASLVPVHKTLMEFRWTLLLLVPAGVSLAGLGGWWMARHALQPVEALTAAARDISIAHLDRRLPLGGTGDELDRLADTFNQMFTRLEAAVEQMKQFTASISHELRTPLTALRGEAEVTLLQGRSTEDYRRVLASQLEEFDKLTQMINQLLTLARAEAGEIHLEFDSVDLAALARSLAEHLEPVAAWKGLTLQMSAADEPVRVRGDAQWLERVILNLLDNAIKFTPAGGRVGVEVSAAAGHARLAVRDTGVGIPPEALPHIFERFYRADPSRSKQVNGAGLGLSLVHWIVAAHQGGVQAESEPGRGSCFAVLLPLVEVPARPSEARGHPRY